jgi:hypothetical protein
MIFHNGAECALMKQHSREPPMAGDEASKRAERIPFACTPEEVQRIENWMVRHRVFNRSEALRRLIAQSLAADEGAASVSPPAAGRRRSKTA